MDKESQQLRLRMKFKQCKKIWTALIRGFYSSNCIVSWGILYKAFLTLKSPLLVLFAASISFSDATATTTLLALAASNTSPNALKSLNL